MKTHIALIFGGPGCEHEVSLCSAKNIHEVLKDTSFKISLLAVTKKGIWRLIEGKSLERTSFQNPLLLEDQGLEVELVSRSGVFIRSKDRGEEINPPLSCAFPVIHGDFGEDGKLQSLLKNLDLTFVGSDTLSCQRAFDKIKTKEFIAQTRIPQVPYLGFEDFKPDFGNVVSKLGLPFFMKPARTGSSIGISKVMEEGDFHKAFLKAREHDTKILVEKAISGRELECGVLEDGGGIRVTGLGEIRTKHEFYSYEAKYLDPKGSELIIPARVDSETVKKIQDYTLTCFEKLECRDYARVDFFLSDKNEFFFNEINTHPGFTDISQFPLLWQQEGLGYRELILTLIKQAMNRSTSSGP